MAKVCYLTVQWLEQARYTADNLLIAKMMSDLGKPLDTELSFYVENDSNDSSLFFEALKILFTIDSQFDEDEETMLLLSNSDIKNWIELSSKIQKSSMYEAFRMAQVGLETKVDSSSDHFDGEMEGEFKDDGFYLKMKGTSYYMMYHEFLEDLISFLKELKKQLQIWEDIYNEHVERNQRNSYNAS
jgi:hypothetical protein